MGEENATNLVVLAIEIILAVLVVAFIGFALSIGSDMRSSYQRTVDASNRMEIYAMMSQYDGTVVSGSEVAEAIFTHTQPGLQVRVNGFVGVWQDVTGNVPAGVSLQNIFTPGGPVAPTGRYNATLIFRLNGSLEAINFAGPF